ncbi:MAG: group 1 glycosyl transferase [Alphaproteobacteria bacterium]|nr:group 1 glycosyl transferase [Alphaproteobacteria bacterium]
MNDASGGSERRAAALYDELRDHADVVLWSGAEPGPQFAEYPIRRIRLQRLAFPRTGTFVFVGLYFELGQWLWLTRPGRIILICNTFQSAELEYRLAHFGRVLGHPAELVYASELVREWGRHPGVVHASPIDIDHFSPSDGGSGHRFTVGRLSRDGPLKHHPRDAALYRRLAEQGCRIRVMGASDALRDAAGENPAIELLPSCAIEAGAFLQGLDCFFYRTSEEAPEPWGRVVTEAMACGLPVVCHRSGGYASIIDHGRNGFLFESDEEAEALLLALERDPALRRRVGREARATIETLLSARNRAEMVDFYCR